MWSLVRTPLVQAQSPQENSAVPVSFEVATIKQSAPDPQAYGIRTAPSGRVTIVAMSVVTLTRLAYGVKVVAAGEPNWVDSEIFDIAAKVDDSLLAGWDKLSETQRDKLVYPMIRSLLEDRFKLKVRHEDTQQSVYALVVAKGGTKLTPAGLPDANAVDRDPEAGTFAQSLQGGYTVKNATMASWAGLLSAQQEVQRPVIDATGLAGRYDFKFAWDRTQNGPGPSIFVALEEQLGLKLESRKAQVDSVVIEHVEKPSEN
jgi:uncharacterized protein (TIGR03435 family)